MVNSNIAGFSTSDELLHERTLLHKPDCAILNGDVFCNCGATKGRRARAWFSSLSINETKEMVQKTWPSGFYSHLDVARYPQLMKRLYEEHGEGR